MLVELIEFKNPDELGNDIYVSKIHWPSQDQARLIHLLTGACSKFGLVHSVRTKMSCWPGNPWYAFITFFSKVAARQALSALSIAPLVIEGLPCKVQPPRNRILTSLPLAVHKCVELANYYVGFNGWSTKVVYKNSEATLTKEQNTQAELYAVGMQLAFHSANQDDFVVEGVGSYSAVRDWSSETNGATLYMQDVIFAMQKARSQALQSAFAKVMLCILDNTKVRVALNPLREDPFFYNSLWSKERFVQVHRLSDEETKGRSSQQGKVGFSLF